ncbi:peptidoglycan D,D-transpeptidase FtsI family protein [Paenibacillus turpanensis]|uniref:peptidoglycan D,D-transpeptidase FtsI family protein n=1 Tax=Paenibacillus turpanensis TaxID=2689078 RepID=UPI00140BFD15|nr:penicillin-binding transpeptidase domain-containing protein [Paenibacillus turpanensis]
MDDEELKEITRQRQFTLRLNIFFFATFVLFSVLIVNLAILQFVRGKELAAQEAKIGSMSSKIAPIRGNIYDANGYPIAYSVSTQTLFYRIEPGMKKPHYIELAYRLEDIFKKLDESAAARGVAPVNAVLTAEEIIKRMDVGFDLEGKATKEPSYYAVPRVIKSGLNNEEIAYFMGHRDELPGFEINEESIRKYHDDNDEYIAAQLIGYLRPYNTEQNNKNSPYFGKKTDYLPNEYVGIDGIELMYQNELRGKNGVKSYPVNAEQKIIGKVSIEKPVKGENLFLTIDKNVQLEAQRAIRQNLEYMKSAEARALKFPYLGKNAASGYAVAMEVQTGRVVAMANFPDYDPNIWHGGLSNQQLFDIRFRYANGTIRERYTDVPKGEDHGNHPSSLVPLGSTVKPLTVLIGLNEGIITSRERYYDSGKFSYGRDNSTIRNADETAFGNITAESAIRFSSNTFMGEMIALRLYNKHAGETIKVWDSYMKKFGLGVDTGSGLPYENAGDLYWEKLDETVQSQIVFASFGQMARYTTLQLAQYTTTLANRGKRLKPLLVDSIRDSEGNLVKQFEPEILNEEKFPAEYWNLIQRGMESPVSGFDNFPHTLVRKTGTSQSSIRGSIVDNAVFIGYAPAENPKLAVAVVVPEGGYGRYGAAPIARKIFDAYDQYYGLNK